MSVTVTTAEAAAGEAAHQGIHGGELTSDEMYRLGLEASVGGAGAGFDLIAAHKWFNLAAMGGNMEARAYRAELAREMSTEEVAEAQRQAREYLKTKQPRLQS